ncbi:MAG: ferritin [Elusimicrobia bacterium]|nr:ferritin [Elusimicrobiota bacterium]
MIPNKKMEEMLNKQMNAEFYNSHLYMAMAAWFENQNLPGFASWMEVQAEEERKHALKFYNHLKERRGNIKVSQVPQPPANYKNALDVFQSALDHEIAVSKEINKMMEAALAEKDYAAVQLLNWFVSEQVEEEAQTDAVVQQLKMIGESRGSLMYIDRHLAKRKE